jgi:hypothetical protein
MAHDVDVTQQTVRIPPWDTGGILPPMEVQPTPPTETLPSQLHPQLPYWTTAMLVQGMLWLYGDELRGSETSTEVDGGIVRVKLEQGSKLVVSVLIRDGKLEVMFGEVFAADRQAFLKELMYLTNMAAAEAALFPIFFRKKKKAQRSK